MRISIEPRRWTPTGRASRTATRSSLQNLPQLAIVEESGCRGWDGLAIVAGAGIAGLSAALALHNRGIAVRVLEAGESLRNEGAAIGLWDNAWIALEQLGVADALRPHYLPLNM
jgi:hypothetical protein